MEIKYYGDIMNVLLNNVYNYIKQNDMIHSGDRIVVGLSGGADSVCLLLSLCELSNNLGITRNDIIAVHINHMLRGVEADSDEDFSAKLCEKLGIEFCLYRENVALYAEKHHCTTEEAGRECRYRCFRETAEKNKCNKIAVAHNRNDMAETVIFNLIRGSGLNGMGGIPAVRDEIIRPLLSTTRDSIEEYLSVCGQEYCTDRTNLGTDYDRNIIRHNILPVFEQINTSALDHICQTAEEAAESYSYIHSKAVERYFGSMEKDNCRTVELNIDELCKIEQILQEHIIHEALADVAGRRKDLTRRHISSVVSLIYRNTGKTVMLPYGICARRSYNRLIISNEEKNMENYYIEINEDGVYEIPSWGRLQIEKQDYREAMEIPKKTYTKIFDYGKIKDRLCIRTPQEGDYIIIDNAGKHKKLSRVFIDNKIDRDLRESWPVLASGHEILWAVGLRYNLSYGVNDDTKHILYVKCTRKGEEDGR